MTNEELIVLYREAKAAEKSKDVESIINTLIEQNKGIIYYFAQRYLPLITHSHYEIDDLVQEGWIAFLDSVERFNIDGENLFTTFAGSNIRFSILNFINRKCIDREKKNELNQRVLTVSVDSILPGAEELTIGETIEDPEALHAFEKVDFEIDNLILRCDLLDSIDAVFCDENQDVKNKRRKYILMRHYGLDGTPISLGEIANNLNVVKQTIYIQHQDAIWDLQHSPVGHYLMKKYRGRIIEDLEADKYLNYQSKDVASIACHIESVESQIKEIDNIDSIESQIKNIDNLLDNILNAS